jgi:hypothetical protein
VGVAVAAAAVGSMVWAGPAAAAPKSAGNAFTSAYRFNTSHQVGKRWDVAVIEVIRDANSVCKRTDPYVYTKPKKGYQYVVVDFRMKKLTGGPAELMDQDVGFELVTNGRKHKYAEQTGIVAPNDASNTAPISKGQSIAGTFTFQVRKADVEKVRVLARDSRSHALKYFKL